jgi:hypothetical protein
LAKTFWSFPREFSSLRAIVWGQSIEPAPKLPRIGALATHGLDPFGPVEFAHNATSNIDM